MRDGGRSVSAFVFIGFHAVAGADEVAVAMDIIDAADGWPELVLAEVGQGIGGLLAGVGVRPIVCTNRFRRVRGVLEWIVGGI